MIFVLTRLLLMLTLVANASVAAWAMPPAGGERDCGHGAAATLVVHNHGGHASGAVVADLAGAGQDDAHDCCEQPACDCGSLLPAALPAARLASGMPAPATAPALTPPLRDASGRDSPPLRPPAG